MGIPRIIFPVLFIIGLAIIITGGVLGSKNGFSTQCKPGEGGCSSESKKLTSASIMLMVGSIFLICGGIGGYFEYKKTGKVSDMFNLKSV